MHIGEAIQYIEYLFEKDDEEKMFWRWIASPLQFEMSFDSFREQLRPVPAKNEEEILDGVYEIIRMTEGAE